MKIKTKMHEVFHYLCNTILTYNINCLEKRLTYIFKDTKHTKIMHSLSIELLLFHLENE